MAAGGGAAADEALHVVVHGASVVADARDTFAVYLIEVMEGERRWNITRRWSEVRMPPAYAASQRVPPLSNQTAALALRYASHAQSSGYNGYSGYMTVT